MPITIDINFRDDWEESKHPRAKGGSHGGQFVKKGAEGTSSAKGRVEKGVPYHPENWKPMKEIHQAATHETMSVHEKAEKIKHISTQYKAEKVAPYANKVLKVLEIAHGLTPGALGKAQKKGEGGPAPAPTHEPKTPEPPPKEEPKEESKKEPDLPAPDPKKIREQVLHKLALAKPKELKGVLEHYAKQEINDPHALAYGNKLLKALGQEPIALPEPKKETPNGAPEPPPGVDAWTVNHAKEIAAAGKIGTLKDLATAAEDKHPELASWLLDMAAWASDQMKKKGEPKEDKTYGPKPSKPGANMQFTNMMHEMAENPNISKEDKIKALKEQVEKYPNALASEHAKKWLYHLTGEGSPTPTPTAAPAPTPAAKPSKNVIKTKATPRVQKAIDAYVKAFKPTSAVEPAVKKVIPTLSGSTWEKMPAKAKSAIQYYSGSGYSIINSALRNPEAANAATVNRVHEIDELFDSEEAQVQEDVVLMRGEHVPDENIEKIKKSLAAGLPTRIQKEGFISTSAAKTPAFAHHNTWYEILTPKGTPALGLQPISSHKGENEVLLRHGQSFEVLEYRYEEGKHKIRMIAKP